MCVQVGVVLLAVSMVGPAGEYMRKPVSHWSHDDVMAWITGLGNWAHHNISLTFQKEVGGTGVCLAEYWD